MPRPLRIDNGEVVYHVINRANARMQIFENPDDYLLFEDALREAKERIDMRILAYCVMPNHWHLILHPRNDGDLSKFTGWLTMTHTQRWHAHKKTIGMGHLYQGRYKSFPIQTDEYFLTACRYVEQNPLRARLVVRAQDWRWSSLWVREQGVCAQKSLLDSWPLDIPEYYSAWVDERETEDSLGKLRVCVNRGQPFGSKTWTENTIKLFSLESTVRPRGRPAAIKKGS